MAALSNAGEKVVELSGAQLGRAGLGRLDREADFMLATMRRLPELGFLQYEVSNYSKPGCQCLHNLSVWNMARWIGLGPSAASQWRATRARNPDSLELWARALKGGVFQNCDVVRLSEQMLFADCIILDWTLSTLSCEPVLALN